MSFQEEEKYLHSIKVEASISNAHILSKHLGKCHNLHGHNYDVTVEVTITDGAFKVVSKDDGMLADFGTIKRIINQYDHCFVYNFNSELEMEFAQLASKHGMLIMDLGMETTAENFSKKLVDDIVQEIKLSFLTQIGNDYDADLFFHEHADVKVSCAETHNNIATTSTRTYFRLS